MESRLSIAVRCGSALECREEVKPYYCSRECQRKVSPHQLTLYMIRLLTLYKHWFTHRYACRRSAPHANPILEDDGDPNWIDVEIYAPRYEDDALVEGALLANKEGAEIFIDIPNDSPYRKGEVMRIRTRTLSVAFLRSYRAQWELPPGERLRRDELGESIN